MTPQDSSDGQNILVTAASKHGSTAEISERIAGVLTSAGMRVTHADSAHIGDLAGYQAVVLGSAVYAGHWLDPAKRLAAQIGNLDPKPAVWLFSSGPIGDPPKPEEDPVDVAEIQAQTEARDHRVFAGKLDKSKLGFGERAIVVAVRAAEGDFRDWSEIEDWARGIAEALAPTRQ